MKTISPVFASDKANLASFAHDRAKLEVLVNSQAFSADPETILEPIGFRKVWIKTTVGHSAQMVINSLEMRDVDPAIFTAVFGWNPAKTTDSDEYDALCSKLPADWQAQYYRADKAQITVATLVELAYGCEESGEQILAIVTPKDARIMRDDAWAKKLQDRAAQFCTTQKVEMASFPFFNALSREIRRLADKRESYFEGEASAERYATYQAAGSSAYWADNDYMSDRLSQPIQDLQELMRFCRVKLPCQYALWKESRIKPK